ncbi:hypothetical protein Bbelb_283270 [Branchiostoma belcheri]|nr:hypothetical protein Bbelb_283270 [Branchiostoma belcheri]
MPRSPPALFSLCTTVVADVLYRTYSTNRVQIRSAIENLGLPRLFQHALFEFFENVRVRVMRYKIYLYLHEPITPSLNALQNVQRECSLHVEYINEVPTSARLHDHETGIVFEFVEPSECTTIIVSCRGSNPSMLQIFLLFRDYNIFDRPPLDADWVCLPETHVRVMTNNLRVSYYIRHLYDGFPSDMMYMLELYRRFMLTRQTIMATGFDGPFGERMRYLRHDCVQSIPNSN